jgi:predicted DCC family thiol-disulfide oxidoreductase YuxK
VNPGKACVPEPVMIPIDMARDATASTVRETGRAQWVVLYDADCGFCRWSLAQLLALDRERVLRPVPLGTAEADALLPDLSPAARAASWHLVSPEGRRESAGAAAPPLLELLPRGRGAAAILRRAPALTERAYRWVADHRSLLSKAIPRAAKEHARTRIDAHAASSEGSVRAR